MPIPAQVTKDALAKLPEVIRNEFVPVEGKDGLFMLDVDPGDSGLHLADVTNLQTALTKERTTAKDFSRKLKEYEGLDAKAAREALEFKTKFDAGELTDEAKARLTEKEKQLAEKFEAQKKQLEESHTAVQSKAKEREDFLTRNLHQAMVTSTVRTAIAASSGNTALLEPYVQQRIKLVEEDGKFITQVIGDNGQPLLSRKTGATTAPMTVDEFVSSLKDNKTFAAAFAGSGSSGTGSSGSSSSTRGEDNEFTLTREEAKDVHRYRDMRERAAKAGKTLRITD